MESTIKDRITGSPYRTVLTGLYIAAVLVLFLFAVDLMTSALRNLSPLATESIIVATSNPFTGFFIGLLITAMVQSSSTTTSMAVALVASRSISLESAVPIIMGANVGTTITSTIVALGFIDKKKELRRALATGTYHDFFNILTAFILFPLEYYYGFLSGLSAFVADSVFDPGNPGTGTRGYLLIAAFGPVIEFLLRAIPSGFVVALLSFGLLFASVIVFRRIIARLLAVQTPERFSKFLFTNSSRAFLWGAVTTAAIRSSTVTTTLLVPLAAKKIISLRHAVPFIIGANIGTTITAFIAAMLNAESAGVIGLAIAHILFNVIGFLVFYPVPALRNIPTRLAAGLGRLSLTHRLSGFVYILVVFFFIPFSLVYFNRGAMEVLDVRYTITDGRSGRTDHYHIISRMNLQTRVGEWLKFRNDGGGPDSEPDEIVAVSQKNNVLFIDDRMHMFNRPGFCWDGEDAGGRYTTCVQDILPRLSLAGHTFDSVYVYQQRFVEGTPSGATMARYYVSVYYPLILKTESLDATGTIIRSEEITRLVRK